MLFIVEPPASHQPPRGAMFHGSGGSAQGIRRLLDLRKYDQALALCLHLLASDPDSAELHRLAGVAALALDDLTVAQRHLEIALTHDPEDSETLYQLSRMWQAKKRPREAEATVKRAIERFPYAAMYWAHLAWIHYQEQAYHRAREPAEKALQLDPDDPHVGNIHALVMAECESGTKLDLDAQEARMLEILRWDPEDAAVQHNLGLFYLHERGDYEKAIEHLTSAAQLDPAERHSRDALVTALRRNDRFLKWLYLPHRGVLAAKHAWRWAARTRWGYAPLALLGVVLLLPVSTLAVFWGVWIWPLAKTYEFLTIAELRQRMRVMGGSGWLRVHAWPKWVRLGTLVITYALFWLGMIIYWNTALVKIVLGLTVSLVLMELFGVSIKEQLLQIREDWRRR